MPRSGRSRRAAPPPPPPSSASAAAFQLSASAGSGGRCERRRSAAVEAAADTANDGKPAAAAAAAQRRRARARESEAERRAERRLERRAERRVERRAERRAERQADWQVERRRRVNEGGAFEESAARMRIEEEDGDEADAAAKADCERRCGIEREWARRRSADVGLDVGYSDEEYGYGGGKTWERGGRFKDAVLIASPSGPWHGLSLPARAAVAVAGFLLVYYVLFAKHRSWEGPGSESDARRLAAAASRAPGNFSLSGGQAKLPPPSRPPPIWHEEVMGMLAEKRRASSAAAVSKEPESHVPRNYALEAAQAAAMDEGEKARVQATKTLPGSNAASQERSMKRKTVDDGNVLFSARPKPDGVDSQGTTMASKPQAVSLVTDAVADGDGATSSDDASSSSDAGAATQGLKEKRKKRKNRKKKKKLAGAHSSETSVLSKSRAHGNSTSAADSSYAGAEGGEVESSEKASDKKTRSSKPTADVSEPSSEHSITSLVPSPSSNSRTTSGGRPQFTNLDPPDVPEGEIQLLHWNYDAVTDPGTAKQYFALRGHDHVASFKPLCLNPDTQKVVTMQEPRSCGGYNRTAGWMIQYCSTVEESFDKECNLEMDTVTTGKEWLKEQEEKKNVVWVEGLTVLQVYEKNCGNIAHFAGRATMLQHVLDNINAYAAPPYDVENVLVVPTFHIMKRFLYPHNYAFWHKSFMRAILAPSKYSIGTLGNFLYRASTKPFNGIPRSHLLHNFSMVGSNFGEGKVVCFRRAIVPGFFKDRYFADDREYPSDKPSIQSKIPATPKIPRDSLRMRERVSALLHKSTNIQTMTKRIVYMDRGGTRRKIAIEDKDKLFSVLEAAAKKRLFKFEVVSFDDKHFKDQVAVMETAGIAIGVHGANLVNTMFMPPLSALVEMFPFKFHHGMYEEGGGSGLKYFSYEMTAGELFKGKRKYKSTEDCIKLSSECKVHYRDAELKFTEKDYKGVADRLNDAMDWFDAVRKRSVPSSRRRLLTQRRRRAPRRPELNNREASRGRPPGRRAGSII